VTGFRRVLFRSGAVRLPYCVDVRLRFRIAGRLEYRWTWTVPQQSSLRRLQRYRGLLRHAILVLFGSAHPEGTVLYPARRLHLRSPDHQWRDEAAHGIAEVDEEMIA